MKFREAPLAALVTGRGSQVLGVAATQAVSAEIYHVQTGSIYPDISPDNYGHPLIYTTSIHEQRALTQKKTLSFATQIATNIIKVDGAVHMAIYGIV